MPSPIELELAERRRQSAEAYRLAGMPPIGGGAPTPEEIAAEVEAKRIADEAEAARLAEEEKGLNDAGKAALQKERDARKAAAKEAAEAKAELETLRKAKADADAAKAQAEEDEAKRNGEFEQLATKRAEELQAVTGERDSLKSRLETALTLIGATVDQEWKAAPDAVTKLYKGEDTDVLAKRQHLADHADIIAALIGKQDERKQAAGFGRTPKPNGSLTNLEKGIEAGKRSGKYSA